MNSTDIGARIVRRMLLVAFTWCGLGPSLHATGSSGAVPAQGSSASVELRGVLSIGDIRRFRVCEPAANCAAWLAVGERCGDVIVDAYDASTDSVVVERAGEKLTLTLPKSTLGLAGDSDALSAAEPSVVLPALTVARSVDITAESRAHGIVRR